ncbi:hypothetical protein [Halarchaeum nitratireducens]|nr:hypothetical protein [Halarchaeum nitratireducens]
MSEAVASGTCALCGASHGVAHTETPQHGPVPLCRSCRRLWGERE